MKNQINEIKDGIYFQKLSIILTNIQQWEKEKNSKISDVYGHSIFNVLAKLERNGKELNNQMNEFLKMMNLQYAFLSKLKKDDRVVEISPFYRQFKEFGDHFGIIKESLLELSEYIGKMMGVTSYEFTELKRIYDEVDQIKTKLENYKVKQTHQFNHKKELIYSKKNIKKTFEFAKMIDIMGDIPKEKIYYNQLSTKLFGIYQKQLQNKEKMYKDICDNIEFISKLYERSFQKQLLSKIMLYFKNKLDVVINQEKQYLQQCRLDGDKTEKAFLEIEQKFFYYFNEFLNEITITHWPVLYSSKEKQRQKEEESSIKQMNTSLILTFDNKLIFYPESKKALTLEINLQDIKIYKADANGRFEIKNRKTKERFYIKFLKMENEDEFFLHYQQIAQKA